VRNSISNEWMSTRNEVSYTFSNAHFFVPNFIEILKMIVELTND